MGLLISPDRFPDPEGDDSTPESAADQSAVLAGGCFWCVEAVFKQLDGVLEVRSGYAGGSAESADYQAVCSGTTDHAEVIEIRFDPSRISYGQLLKVFFSVAHDPTQLDRQGPDTGRQYRSAIFYADPEQKRIAEAYIDQLDRARVFDGPIATRLEALETFYLAEEYHQDYAKRNPAQPYVSFNVAPKVEKVQKHFADRLREK